VRENENIRIPVIEEQVSVDKTMVTTGSLLVKKTVEEVLHPLSELLTSEEYEVVRIPKQQFLDHTPESVQHHADRIVIAVVEERAVIEKKLVLVEEIHLIRKESRKEFKDEIPLKKEVVTIERKPAK
jgi:stress response protein YsnF